MVIIVRLALIIAIAYIVYLIVKKVNDKKNDDFEKRDN